MIVTEKPLGTESPVNAYWPAPAQFEYGLRSLSFTTSAAERATVSAVASFRWSAETVIDAKRPPRIALNVTPTIAIVMMISTSENPASERMSWRRMRSLLSRS